MFMCVFYFCVKIVIRYKIDTAWTLVIGLALGQRLEVSFVQVLRVSFAGVCALFRYCCGQASLRSLCLVFFTVFVGFCALFVQDLLGVICAGFWACLLRALCFI